MKTARQQQSEKALPAIQSLMAPASTASLLTDEPFSYASQDQRLSTHRVRIFPNHSWFAVVVTDCSNQGECLSISSSIDCFIPALLAAHPEISPRRIVVIEHHNGTPRSPDASSLPNDERFDLISFGQEASSGHCLYAERKPINRGEAEQWTGVTLR